MLDKMLPRFRRCVVMMVMVVVHLAVVVWMVDKYKTSTVYELKPKAFPIVFEKDDTLKVADSTTNIHSDSLKNQTASITRLPTAKKEQLVFSQSKVYHPIDDRKNNTSPKGQDGHSDGDMLPVKEKDDIFSDLQSPQQVIDEVFQPIAGSQSFVFSVFIMDPKTVRAILLFSKNDDSPYKFSCVYRQHSTVIDQSPIVLDKVKGKLMQILDDHGKPYNAVFLTCPLPDKVSEIKDLLISIVYGQYQDSPSNLLPAQRSPEQSSWEFTVCIAPFHSNYNDMDALVEMIELNRILGAQHFYFYNESCSAGIAKILAYYEKEGLVNTIQWHLPHKRSQAKGSKHVNIHYKGQNAAINDCLYRNRMRSQYVVIQDVDEFIIPHNPNVSSWSEFVKSRLALGGETKSNFLVRSSLYRKEWVDPGNKFPLLDRAKAFNSLPLQIIQRHKEVYPYKNRSKYIVNPLLIVEGGIHYVHRHNGGVTDEVPISEAIVHHYRKQWNPKYPRERIFDDIVVRKYGERLVKAVEHARNGIGL